MLFHVLQKLFFLYFKKLNLVVQIFNVNFNSVNFALNHLRLLGGRLALGVFQLRKSYHARGPKEAFLVVFVPKITLYLSNLNISWDICIALWPQGARGRRRGIGTHAQAHLDGRNAKNFKQ